MKKLTACLTLTLLFAFALSVSAATFEIIIVSKAVGKDTCSSIIKDTNTSFYVTFLDSSGKKDTADSIRGFIGGIKTKTFSNIGKTSSSSWKGSIYVYRKGYYLSTSPLKSSLKDTVTWSESSAQLTALYCYAVEIPPTINPYSSPSSDTLILNKITNFMWTSTDSINITAQSLWISYNNEPFKKLDTLIPKKDSTIIENTYSWIPDSITSIQLKVNAWNSDTSNSKIFGPFFIINPSTNIKKGNPKNSTKNDRIQVFNVQGKLIYKGVRASNLNISIGNYLIKTPILATMQLYKR